jgi:hypothetical protein
MAGETAAVRAALQRIANLDGGAALIFRAGLAARGAVAGAGPSNAPNVGAARGAQAAAEARIAARRQATEAEEEFLQSQERQTQQEEAHLLGLIEADEVDMEDIDAAFDEYVPSDVEVCKKAERALFHTWFLSSNSMPACGRLFCSCSALRGSCVI